MYLPQILKNENSPTESYFMSIWHNRLYLYSAAALVFGIWFSLKMALKKKSFSKDIGPWVYKAVKNNDRSDRDTVVHVSGVKIFYGSQTGTAKGFAMELSEEVKNLGVAAEVTDMKDYDPDDQLADECTSKSVCVFLVATYTDGQPTENAEWFCKWLEEASTDFRYGKTYLKGLRYAVFGLGNSVYVGHYNTLNNVPSYKFDSWSLAVGKNVDKWLWMLSGTRVMTRGEGDCNVVKSRNGSIQADFQAWKVKFLKRLQALAKGEKKSCSGNCKTGGSCKNKRKGAHVEAEEEEKGALQNANSEHSVHSAEVTFNRNREQLRTVARGPSSDALIESSSDDDESSLQDEKKSRSVVDMEDLGNIMNSVKKAKFWGSSVVVQQVYFQCSRVKVCKPVPSQYSASSTVDQSEFVE
ncbi:hypothetical protein INR49_021277 [Caranx melampygus]|nr:hypothetical protein INR49_021277 [Caranx melampygus]